MRSTINMLTCEQPVVHTRSAFIGLPEEITETIWAHHRDLCRFSNEDDPGYKKVVRRIIEFVADAALGSSSTSSLATQSNMHSSREVPDRLDVASGAPE